MARKSNTERKADRNRASSRLSAAEIKRAAVGRWHEILAAASIAPEVLDGGHHPCPKCGGADRFRFTDLDGNGSVLCNQCPGGRNIGDGLESLNWWLGQRLPQSIAFVAEFLGISPASPPSNGRYHANGHAAPAKPKAAADPEKHLVWREWSDAVAALFFCRAKRGVTIEALKAFGARLATYRQKYLVVALPVRDPASGNPAKTVGWVLYEQSGGKLPAFHGPASKKAPTWEKVLLTAGSKPGLIAPDSFFTGASSLSPEAEQRRGAGTLVWKVEGPSDALALWAAIPAEQRQGHLVITNSSGAKQNPQPTWLACLTGRHVNILHDADQPGEEGAAKWVRAAVGVPGVGEVRHVKLPYAIEATHGKDLRDFINELPGAWQRIVELAAAAAPIAPQELPAATPIESDDDPHRLARLWLAEQPGQIIYWRCDYYRWSGQCYRHVADEQFVSELTGCIKREFDRLNLLDQEDGAAGEDGSPKQCRHVTSAKVGNTRLAVNGITITPSRAEPPRHQSMPGKHCISLTNGILDVDALLSGADLADVLLPHTPAFFTLNALPFPFDPAAECPRWLDTLNVNQEGDQQRLSLLQEWAGYLLTPDTSEQKFLICEGEGNNGKSVYLAGIEAMLGLENVSHVPLEHFAHRFALTSTLHKLANIAADCGDLDKVAEGFLKSFTSGDRMMFDRKNKPAIEAAPTARLMLATNNRPRFSDRSGGLWRRIILVPWRREVPAAERIKGMDKPEFWLASGELPGILNWSVAGLARLREQGGFTRSELVDKGVESYRTEVNPTRQFLLDNVNEAAECHVTCRQLYIHYAEWCKEFGYHKTNEVNFGKEVFRRFPAAKRARKTFGAERPWAYEGIYFSGDVNF